MCVGWKIFGGPIGPLKLMIFIKVVARHVFLVAPGHRATANVEPCDIYGRISELYKVYKVDCGRTNLNLEIIPMLLEIRIIIWCRCSFHVSFSSIMTPKNFELSFCSIRISSIFIFNCMSVLCE